jgi:hypothetical protein
MTNRTQAVLCGIAVGIACSIADISFAEAGFCWGFGCGNNSATVGDGIVFDELNSTGAVTPDNIRLASAKVLIGTVVRPVTLNINGHVLSAVDVATPTKIYGGGQLLNMEFTIEHRDGRSYDVKVTKVCADKETYHACKPLTFWVKPETDVPYYELMVRKMHTRSHARIPPRFPPNPGDKRDDDDRGVETVFKEHLCKGEFLNGDALWTSTPNAAIFFEGDSYDPGKKRVTKTKQSDGWFNIACAGAAPAKMHLLRHTTAGSDAKHKTSTAQRTAMLKMLTADYCGDGRAWTADGTPLDYADARAWYATPDFQPGAVHPDAVEAVWGQEGALCLNVPRRLERSSPPVTSSCQAPAVTRKEVVTACQKNRYRLAPPWINPAASRTKNIPRCSPAWWADAKSHLNVVYVMSANKAPWPDGGDYCGGATEPSP